MKTKILQILSGVVAIVHFASTLKKAVSGEVKCHALAFIAAAVSALCMCSCTTIYKPDGSTINKPNTKLIFGLIDRLLPAIPTAQPVIPTK